MSGLWHQCSILFSVDCQSANMAEMIRIAVSQQQDIVKYHNHSKHSGIMIHLKCQTLFPFCDHLGRQSSFEAFFSDKVTA